MDARDNEKLKSYEKESCVHCGRFKTFEGHDGCLGSLDGLANACCGHGGHGSSASGAYIQFLDGTTIHGEDALTIQQILKQNRSTDSAYERLKFMQGCCKSRENE